MIRATIKTFEELVDTEGVKLIKEDKYVMIQKDGILFLPHMRFLCGCTVEVDDIQACEYYIVVDNQYYIYPWMCSKWEEVNLLEEKFRKLSGLTMVTPTEAYITVNKNDKTFRGFKATRDVIYVAIEDAIGNSTATSLTPEGWLELHDRVMQIIELKKKVDEQE